MRSTLILVLLAISLTACTNGRPVKKAFNSTICNRPVEGFTQTKLKFGDAHLSMKAQSTVIPNSEFRLKIVADKGFGDKNVSIVPKNTASGWLATAPMRVSPGSNVLPADDCVPVSAPIGTVFEFDVVVEDVGTLDPRAEVVRR